MKQDVSKELIDKIPMDIDGYYENTLLNRQYIFDISKKDLGGNTNTRLSYIAPSILYNQYNNLNIGKFVTTPFQSLQFPHTLQYAEKQFEYKPFNYNITNSGLPRTVFVTATDEVLNRHKPFSELIEEINARLAKLPRIKGIAVEATEKLAYYNGVLNNMKAQSFGINDEIRQNIMYSLNALTTKYLYYKSYYEDDIFYNYKYSGMFPIFTWVPLITDPKKMIYNLIRISLWQPFGYVKNKLFHSLGDAYKNFRVPPYSKGLNEAIFKIITKAHSSVLSIPNTQDETERLIDRVEKTVGFYKDLELDPQYIIDNLYFYHGSHNRLHTMEDRENDIQILGFLSTSLNIYTASYYSEVATKGSGYIYIIEADDKQGYINLNDELYQFLILPNSIIRILYEFKFGDTTIILCRLIMTPAKEDNNAMYNNLLGIPQPAKKSDDAFAGASAASVSGGKLKERTRDPYAANTAFVANASFAAYAHSVIQPAKAAYTAKAAKLAKLAKAAKASHSDTKNIIKPKADMRKIGDMPADIREYYGITLTEQNKNEKVDINNGCYVRMISRKVVDRMLADRTGL